MTTIEDSIPKEHKWNDAPFPETPPRRFPEILPVRLAETEIAERARRAAMARNKVAEYEAQKSAAMSSWKAKIELAENERDELLDMISSGVEDRAVECVETFEYRTGVVRVHRVDTGTLVRERAMTSSERQPDLFDNSGTPPADDDDEYEGDGETETAEVEAAGAEEEDSESEITDPQTVLDAEPASTETPAKAVRRRKKS